MSGTATVLCLRWYESNNLPATQLLNPKAESRVSITVTFSVTLKLANRCLEKRRSFESEHQRRRGSSRCTQVEFGPIRNPEDARYAPLDALMANTSLHVCSRWQRRLKTHQRWFSVAERDANTKPHSCHDRSSRNRARHVTSSRLLSLNLLTNVQMTYVETAPPL